MDGPPSAAVPSSAAACASGRQRFLFDKAQLLEPLRTGATGTRAVRAALAQLAARIDEKLCLIWRETGLAAPLALASAAQ